MLSSEVSAPHEESVGSEARRARGHIAALFYKLRCGPRAGCQLLLQQPHIYSPINNPAKFVQY